MINIPNDHRFCITMFFVCALVVVAVLIMTIAYPARRALDSTTLAQGLAAKVDLCHTKGMGAGRLMSGAEVIDIKCYEE